MPNEKHSSCYTLASGTHSQSGVNTLDHHLQREACQGTEEANFSKTGRHLGTH